MLIDDITEIIAVLLANTIADEEKTSDFKIG